jgi:hypothetical protein
MIIKLNQTKLLLENSKLEQKKVQQCDEFREKCEREMKVLRDERKAFEETIDSLRNESEALRTSLTQAFLHGDNLKSELNRITKSTKEMEDQKVRMLKSLYKRLIPIFAMNKKVKLSSNLNGKCDEEFMESLIRELGEYKRSNDECFAALERDSIRKEEHLNGLLKKNDEQLSRLTKTIKEKEIQFANQKETLVAYYEQLLNDVNSRVKVGEKLLSKFFKLK